MALHDLAALTRSTGFPRISIFIPTHKTFPQAQQDSIRLSNALKEAERQLNAANVRNAGDLLSNARARTEEHEFWRYQDRGLAVLIEDGATRWLKLPQSVPELTIVAARYHVRPLIDVFSDAGRFYVLAANRGQVRFLEGDQRELEDIKLDDLPASWDSIKRRTDFDDQTGYHARSRGSSAAPRYHALGESAEDYEEVELEQFVQAIAKAVDHRLSAEAKPLILVAQPRLMGRLRQELKYANIPDDDIQSDPTSMGDKDLHAETWAIAGRILREPRDEIRARCKAWAEGADIPASKDVQELIRSAEEGRIETLLVDRDARLWGSYDEDRRLVHRDDANGPQNEDLLNLLVVKTLSQGGDAISLSEELTEKVGPAVGLYRY